MRYCDQAPPSVSSGTVLLHGRLKSSAAVQIGPYGPIQLGYRRKNWCGTWFTRRQSSRSNTPNTAHFAVRFRAVRLIGRLRSWRMDV
jgi:hypothetical protein